MARRSLHYAGAVAAASLAIVAAGCGGSSSASSTTTATTASTGTTATAPGASAAGFKAFQDCLASHGVTNFTPGAGRQGGATRTPAQQQAFTACRSKLPAGGRPGGRPGGGGAGGAGNPAFAKYATCLKQHGVTLGASNNKTKFAAASAACAKLAPNAGTP